MRVTTENKTKTPQPPFRHRTSREYDFLQYIRLVMKWATTNNDLSRGEVEILLYLYTKGTFNKDTFSKYHRTFGMYQMKTFDKFLEQGWIKMWRPKTKKGEAALYVLTNKGKTLCSKMHKFCTGEMEIPETKANVLSKNNGENPRMYDYYFDAIKKMNRDRDNKNKEEGNAD